MELKRTACCCDNHLYSTGTQFRTWLLAGKVTVARSLKISLLLRKKSYGYAA